MTWLLIGLAFATPGHSVVQELSGGRLDWTRAVLTVEAAAVPHAVNGGSLKATEQEARLKLAATVKSLAREIPVDSGRRCIDLMAEGNAAGSALEDGLQEGRGHWRVVETRYHSSGRVELVAELSLVEWIRPALVDAGLGLEPTAHPGTSTGVLVDARSLEIQPVFAPRLLAPDGQVLYEVGSLSASRSMSRAPVLWIRDPVAPGLAKRVGGSPLVVVADRVERGSDLVLSPRDAARMRAIAASADLLSSAPVAVVIDAD